MGEMAAIESLVSTALLTCRIFLEFQETVYFCRRPRYFFVIKYRMVDDGENDDAFQRALSYTVRKVGKDGLVPKPEQTAVIKAIYGGKDVLVWLPTGFGKSFCFQALPFVTNSKLARMDCSLVLVVSPLVALMADQVHSLQRKGVKAAILSGSGVVDSELLATEKDLGECSLLYGAPEALVKSEIIHTTYPG